VKICAIELDAIPNK